MYSAAASVARDVNSRSRSASIGARSASADSQEERDCVEKCFRTLSDPELRHVYDMEKGFSSLRPRRCRNGLAAWLVPTAVRGADTQAALRGDLLGTATPTASCRGATHAATHPTDRVNSTPSDDEFMRRFVNPGRLLPRACYVNAPSFALPSVVSECS